MMLSSSCRFTRTALPQKLDCMHALEDVIVGGIVVVGFAFLFGLENTGTHALMVVALAGVIALVLFTIAAMEHPFSRGARVGPDAFELVLDRLETSKLSDL